MKNWAGVVKESPVSSIMVTRSVHVRLELYRNLCIRLMHFPFIVFYWRAVIFEKGTSTALVGFGKLLLLSFGILWVDYLRYIITLVGYFSVTMSDISWRNIEKLSFHSKAPWAELLLYICMQAHQLLMHNFWVFGSRPCGIQFLIQVYSIVRIFPPNSLRTFWHGPRSQLP